MPLPVDIGCPAVELSGRHLRSPATAAAACFLVLFSRASTIVRRSSGSRRGHPDAATGRKVLEGYLEHRRGEHTAAANATTPNAGAGTGAVTSTARLLIAILVFAGGVRIALLLLLWRFWASREA